MNNRRDGVAIAARRDVIEATTLGDHLLRAAQTWPDHDALIFPGDDPSHRLTYIALYDRAVWRARSLAAAGVGPGDHVGILMPNCMAYVEVLLGAALLGAVAVPLNARYRAHELAYVVENADISVLLTSGLISEYADFGELLTTALPDLTDQGDLESLSLKAAPRLNRVVMFDGDPPAGFQSQAAFEAAAGQIAPAHVETARQRVRLRDVVILMYTSGTTANPKGCLLTHEALVRNGITINRSRYFLRETDRFWDPLPLFHMSSILPLVCCFDGGAAYLCMTRFEAGAALDYMEREKATFAFPSFPTITAAMINHPDFKNRDLSTLRQINNVAPPDVLRSFQDAFPQAVQTSAYGLTEAAGIACINEPTETLKQRSETCGKPFPGVQVRIVDPEALPDRFEDRPPGEKGEILVKGYNLFEGYYRDADKTAASVVDGWLRTGDIGTMTREGQICFHGRTKDMLKVGGENVAALEIESYIARHPGVRLVQVVGVDDDRLVEVPAAFIELKDGAAVTGDEIIGFCRDQIASFKIPRYVVFVDDWPMSATKVQKHKLKDRPLGKRLVA